jgi:hypothetical protein
MTKKNSKRRSGNRKAGGRSKGSGPSKPQAEYSAATAENSAAWRMVKAFKGPNNKYINSTGTGISGTAALAAPFLFLLNGVGQGTSENTRIGRLCRHKWLDLDLTIENTGTVLGVDVFRVYIIVETTALGSALAPAQFFVDNAAWYPTSQRDRTNRNASRYMVLYDSKPMGVGVNPSASGLVAPSWTGYEALHKSISMHLPLNFDTDYSRGNSGTISDIDTNSMYLLIVSDNGNAIISVTGAYTTCFSDHN